MKTNGSSRDFLAGVSTVWYNESPDYQTWERETLLPVSEMQTNYYESSGLHLEASPQHVAVEVKNGQMIWTFQLPADSAIDFTTLTDRDVDVSMMTPYELYYRLTHSP